MDHTLNLMREGYMYISNRCHSFQSNIFETRLFGKQAICMRGNEAAELFYDSEKFKRNGATPKRVVRSFFGNESVQTLDENTHRHRKERLMSVMTSACLQQRVDITKHNWKEMSTKWEQRDKIILYEEVQKLLCTAAWEWVGVQLQEDEVSKRVKDLAALYESAVAVGPVYWVGRNYRNSLNKWSSELIDEVRNGELNMQD